MTRRVMSTALAALTLCCALATTASAGGFAGYVPGRLLIEFAPGAAPTVAKTADGVAVDHPGFRALGDRFGMKDLSPLFPANGAPDKAGEPDLRWEWTVDFDPAVDLDEAAAAYAALDGVRRVVKDELYYLDAALPNDPSLGQQWYLRNTQYGNKDVRWFGGWVEAQGDSNVVVAVIDSGVDYTHPDLGGTHPDHVNGAIWTNWTEYYGIPGSDDDGNGYVDDFRGWDFVTSVSGTMPGEDASVADNDPMDFGGHGTNCSGCVAPITGNGIGIAGTAGGAKIMALRAGYLRSDGQGLVGMTWAAQAMVYAVNNGAKVLSCSWGSSSILSSAVSLAHSNDVLVVNSAGNDDDEVADYLGTNPYVLSVAATDANDAKASFSSYGLWVELSAPGVAMYTTAYDWTTGSSTYLSVQGTSFSTPLVAGALALIWSAHPDWTDEQVKARLLDTCDDLDAINPSYAGKLGAGRVNLLRALGDGFHEVPAEFPSIGEIVNIATPGDTIAVAASLAIQGPYTIRDKAVSYLGGWDDTFTSRDTQLTPTVVTGTAAATALIIDSGAGPDVIVDGFRCTGGAGGLYSTIPLAGRYGGGLVVNGDATLRNLDVTGNTTGTASQFGGGGGVLLLNSSATLENVHVHGNQAVYGAGIHVRGGAPTLVDCVIEDNTVVTNNANPARGGGIHVSDSHLTMTGCLVSGHLGAEYGGGVYVAPHNGTVGLTTTGNTFRDNTAKVRGGGVYVKNGPLVMLSDVLSGNAATPDAVFMYGGGLATEGASVDMESVQLDDNTAMIGGGMALATVSTVSMRHCTAAGNGASLFGGGVYVDGAAGGDLTNNTIVANNGGGAGGGLYLNNSTLDVTANLAAFNTGPGTTANGFMSGGSTLAFSCNDAFGNDGDQYTVGTDPTGANGNVSVDPEFCDLGALDLTLTQGSPCLPDGSGGCGRIGALGEGCTGGTGVDDTPGATPLVFRVDPNFPNPFNPSTSIRFATALAGPVTVRVYDATGRLVSTLLDETLPAAAHEVLWSGRDDAGRQVGSGLYLYRVTSGGETHTGKMALIK